MQLETTCAVRTAHLPQRLRCARGEQDRFTIIKDVIGDRIREVVS